MLSSAVQGVVISRALRWGRIQAARSNSTRNQLVALESLKLENFFCFVLFSFGGNMFSYNKKLAMWLVWFCVPFPASVGIKASSGFGSTFKSFEENKNIKKERLFFLKICSSSVLKETKQDVLQLLLFSFCSTGV